ncbi:hypothetical protein C8J57DRAFT_1106099 [Mycena rebaudengoi]|nr:hypothetical protein C8J57DRAFT_1106099 [Mycena rebaudengoi]
MAANALRASRTPKEATRALYGPVFHTGRPISVYLASSSRVKGPSAARAAFALYWGRNNRRNSAFRFEGVQVEARASLFAVMAAVDEAPRDQSLIIYTPSQYAIRSFCYWAGDNETLGWPCAHADILQAIVSKISLRSAPLEFRWLAAATANVAMAAAHQMSRDLLERADDTAPMRVKMNEDIRAMDARDLPELDTSKVFSALPEIPAPTNAPEFDLSSDNIIDPDDKHRGRQRYDLTV